MSHTRRTAKQGNVVSIEAARGTQPHPERVKRVKQWHIDHAFCEDPPIATLNISITAGGEIKSSGIAIEMEHAAIMLPELERLTEVLKSHACGIECSVGRNVRALKRRS